jgi:hypothetical protein
VPSLISLAVRRPPWLHNHNTHAQTTKLLND